jgi:DNA-binding FrmR family transcriptional regulator
MDPDPSPLLARLKRVHGHIAAIVSMVTEGRTALELVQQLQAVEHAIASAKRELIQERIEHWLTLAAPAPPEGKLPLTEIKNLAKYL